MSVTPQLSAENSCTTAYYDAKIDHGDIGLDLGKFVSRISEIVDRRVGVSPPTELVAEVVRSLHTADLYLTIGCAEPTEPAWRRFETCFGGFLYRVAYFACGHSEGAREIAAAVVADLYLPDRTGRSRIASFDGTYSLATWLRAVVTNKVIDERRSPRNTNEPLDCLHNIWDARESQKLDAALRASRYSDMVDKALTYACCGLTESESLLLLLCYDQGLRASEIARLNQVHPSTITRRLQQTQAKLRCRVTSTLADTYGLSADSINECFTEVLENPRYSIISILKAEL